MAGSIEGNPDTGFTISIYVIYLIFFLAGILLIASPFIIYYTIKLFVHLHRHSKHYKSILDEAKTNSYNNMPREEIEKYFYLIDHPIYRERYVNYIKDKDITPSGDWTNKEIPNINDSNASGILAELEEKWLNLKK